MSPRSSLPVSWTMASEAGFRLSTRSPSVKTPMLYNATTYAATSSCKIANPRNSVALTYSSHCTYVRKTRFCIATPPARQNHAYSQHASPQQLTNMPPAPTPVNVIAKPTSRRRTPRFLETLRLADQHQSNQPTNWESEIREVADQLTFAPIDARNLKMENYRSADQLDHAALPLMAARRDIFARQACLTHSLYISRHVPEITT
jgi:hypothetical protein